MPGDHMRLSSEEGEYVRLAKIYAIVAVAEFYLPMEDQGSGPKCGERDDIGVLPVVQPPIHPPRQTCNFE
jgi:hypothetical protein